MINLYKQIGETPLQALKRLRRQQPELKGERLSYAGRLDPMAAGILPVLVGEENDRREEFLSAKKRYVFTVLFGVQTDTFDLLGLPTRSVDNCRSCGKEEQKSAACFLCTTNSGSVTIKRSQLQKLSSDLIGPRDMRYPPYSSQTVTLDGKKKPLWKVARQGRLDAVEIPKKEIDVYDLECRQLRSITKGGVLSTVINQVDKVDGNFRQPEITAEWRGVITGMDDQACLPVATFGLHCSAGTYVRRLANTMGKRLGVPATTFSILRTATGDTS